MVLFGVFPVCFLNLVCSDKIADIVFFKNKKGDIRKASIQSF